MRMCGKRLIAGCLAALLLLPNTVFAFNEGVEDSPVPETLFAKPAQPAEFEGAQTMTLAAEDSENVDLFKKEDAILDEADKLLDTLLPDEPEEDIAQTGVVDVIEAESAPLSETGKEEGNTPEDEDKKPEAPIESASGNAQNAEVTEGSGLDKTQLLENPENSEPAKTQSTEKTEAPESDEAQTIEKTEVSESDETQIIEKTEVSESDETQITEKTEVLEPVKTQTNEKTEAPEPVKTQISENAENSESVKTQDTEKIEVAEPDKTQVTENTVNPESDKTQAPATPEPEKEQESEKTENIKSDEKQEPENNINNTENVNNTKSNNIPESENLEVVVQDETKLASPAEQGDKGAENVILPVAYSRVIETKETTKPPVVEYDSSNNSLYANGIPIVIKEANGQTKVFVDSSGGNASISVIENGSKSTTITGTEGVAINTNTLIYGGGKDNSETIPSTNVTLESGEVSYIFGGSKSGNVEVSTVTVKGGSIAGDGLICAGGRGAATFVTTANLTIEDSVNNYEQTAKWIYGGGFYGDVGTSKVTVEGGNFMFVLGGGVNGTVGTANVTVGKNARITETLFGGGWNEGATVGNASVTVSGGYAKIVYGGGYAAEAGTKQISATPSSETSSDSGTQESVAAAPISVMLSGGETSVVYGGSMLEESKSGSTSVSLTGGQAKWVYGGGKYSEVEGNTQIAISGTNLSSADGKGAVYGGGQVADVGDTDISVTGGHVPVLYGGGQLGCAGNTKVSVKGGSVDTLYGGGGIISTGMTAAVDSTSVEVSSGKVKYLYGGGYASVVNQTASVTLSGGEVDELYGGGATVKANVLGDAVQSDSGTPAAVTVNMTGGSVNYLYGGGRYGSVNSTVEVNVSGGTVTGNVYGGGRNMDSQVFYSTVNINNVGNTVPTVFGGGEYGSVYKSTLNISSNVGFACGGCYYSGSNEIELDVKGCEVKTLCGGDYAVGSSPSVTLSIDNSDNNKNMVQVGQLICGGGTEGSSAKTKLHIKDGLVLQMYPGYHDGNDNANTYIISGGSIPEQHFGEDYYFVDSDASDDSTTAGSDSAKTPNRVYAVDIRIDEPARVSKDVIVKLDDVNGQAWETHTRTTRLGRLVVYLPKMTFTESNPLKVTMNGTEYTNSDASVEEIKVNSVTVSKPKDTMEYTVSFSSNDGGSVTATANGQPLTSGSKVVSGTDVTFTAIPNTSGVQKYAFLNWIRNDSPDSTNQTVIYPVTSDIDMKANFVEGFKVSFEAASNSEETLGGTVKAFSQSSASRTKVYSGTTVKKGAVLEFVAEPMNGCTFDGWEVNGSPQTEGVTTTTDSSVYKINSLAEDISVKAKFQVPIEIKSHNVTLDSCSNGSIEADPKGSVTVGTTVTVTVEPDEGYKLKSLKLNDEDVTSAVNDNSYEFEMPDYDVTISAEFEPKTYKLNVENATPNGGSVKLYDDEENEIISDVAYGKKIKVKVTENDGYKLYSIDFDGVSAPSENEGTYEFTMPANEVKISVSFIVEEEESKVHSISVEPYENGKVTVNPSGMVNDGDTVTVTAEPYEGYKLNSLVWSYTDKSGEKVEAKINSGDSFNMPDADVKITVEFVKSGSSSGDDDPGGDDNKPGGDDDNKPGGDDDDNKPGGDDDDNKPGGDDDDNKPGGDDDDNKPGGDDDNNKPGGDDNNKPDDDNSGNTSNSSGGHMGGSSPAKWPGSSSQGSSGGNASVDNAAGNTGSGGTTGGSDKTDKNNSTPVGTPSEIKVQAPVEQSSGSDGRVSVTTSYDEIERALKENNAENADMRIAPSVNNKPDAADVVIPMEAVRLMTENNIKSLMVEHPVGPTVRINGSALKSVYSQGGRVVKLSVEPTTSLSTEAIAKIDGRPVYSIRLTIDGSPMTSFDGGSIQLRLPYNPQPDEDTAYIKACYVDGEGKVDVFADSRYISEEGVVETDTPHLSVFGVVYTKETPIQFTDIEGHWGKDAILELAGLGIVKGVTETEFKPDEPLKRGMLITLLGRMSGVKEESSGDTGFTDVPASAYYAPYTSWAKENGLAQGVGDGRFQPMANITREQLAVLLYRYSDMKGNTIPLANSAELFDDDAQISDWAKEAVYALRVAGILNGMGDNNYSPRSGATRAQVCSVLQRIM